MEIHNKLLVFSLMLVLVLSLAGCGSDGGNGGDSDDGLVWDTYSNDYFSFKYPDEWDKVEEDINKTDADVVYGKNVNIKEDNLDKGGIGFVILHNLEEDELSPNNEEEFYEIEEVSSDELPSDTTLESAKKTTLDGHPAYKIIIKQEATDENGLEIDMKFIDIAYYYEGTSNELRYVATLDKYSEAMADEIISSIKIK